MAFLYDNLTAVVVGTTVLLILASLQHGGFEPGRGPHPVGGDCDVDGRGP